MELDKRQWYVRWFFWSLMVWDEFRETDSSWKFENGTNLCHFIRVMLVWCPLVLLLNATVYGSGIAALTALPISLYGGVGYAWVVGIFTFVVGLVLVMKSVSRRLGKWKHRRPVVHKSEKKKVTPKVAAAPTGPGFFEVLWKYIVGLKKKVCPIITCNRQAQEAV